ncbi:ABC transporter permease subunit [Ornithinimicrobium cerasi]|uniref:ABC transporter permease subunit n=1 Tax=Ornithinimicrobium cerasi TaxID=2248773 RepID=UPI000EFFEDF9|nr:ABC transporter permease subunit [Ornithinimicrobium cerasi]
MTRLLRVELHRLIARKVVWLTVLAALAIGLLTVSGVFLQARSIDQARAGLNQDYEQMVEQVERDRESCQVEEERERRRTGDPSVDFGCEGIVVPTLEEMYGQMPSLNDQYRTLLSGSSYAFMFLALAMGSTAVAAEFAHRTMGSLLTFVPRRTPVFAAKVLAPALASIPHVLVGLTTLLLGIPAVFRWFRIDDAVTGAEWVSLGWMALRIITITMLAAALGAAAAFLVRHSGMVIGIMVGYLVLVETFVAGAGGGPLGKLALTRNIAAWVQNGTVWESWPMSCGPFEECRPIRHELSFTHGAVELGLLLAVIMLLGWLRFRRSDLD